MPTSQPANAQLRDLITAYTVSRAGDYLYNIALVAYVYGRTGSPAWTAATCAARLVPAVVGTPFTSVLADRYDRGAVARTCFGLGALVMAGLALTAATGGPLALVLLWAFLGVLLTGPARPALVALIPSVAPERTAQANSALGIAESVSIVVGPGTAALALLLGPGWLPFALNGASFLVAAGLLRGLRRDEPAAAGADAGLAAVRRGLQVARRPDVARLVLFTALAGLLYGCQMVLVVPVSLELLGTGTWGAGWLEAAAGGGGILAAVWLQRRPAAAELRHALPVAVLLGSAGLAALAFVDSVPLAWACMLVAGAGALVVDVVGLTQLQSLVDRSVLGRVDGLLTSAGVTSILLGNLLGAVLTAGLGVRPALVLCALAAAAPVLLPRRAARQPGPAPLPVLVGAPSVA